MPITQKPKSMALFAILQFVLWNGRALKLHRGALKVHYLADAAQDKNSSNPVSVKLMEKDRMSHGSSERNLYLGTSDWKKHARADDSEFYATMAAYGGFTNNQRAVNCFQKCWEKGVNISEIIDTNLVFQLNFRKRENIVIDYDTQQYEQGCYRAPGDRTVRFWTETSVDLTVECERYMHQPTPAPTPVPTEDPFLNSPTPTSSPEGEEEVGNNGNNGNSNNNNNNNNNNVVTPNPTPPPTHSPTPIPTPKPPTPSPTKSPPITMAPTPSPTSVHMPKPGNHWSCRKRARELLVNHSSSTNDGNFTTDVQRECSSPRATVLATSKTYDMGSKEEFRHIFFINSTRWEEMAKDLVDNILDFEEYWDIPLWSDEQHDYLTREYFVKHYRDHIPIWCGLVAVTKNMDGAIQHGADARGWALNPETKDEHTPMLYNWEAGDTIQIINNKNSRHVMPMSGVIGQGRAKFVISSVNAFTGREDWSNAVMDYSVTLENKDMNTTMGDGPTMWTPTWMGPLVFQRTTMFAEAAKLHPDDGLGILTLEHELVDGFSWHAGANILQCDVPSTSYSQTSNGTNPSTTPLLRKVFDLHWTLDDSSKIYARFYKHNETNFFYNIAPRKSLARLRTPSSWSLGEDDSSMKYSNSHIYNVSIFVGDTFEITSGLGMDGYPIDINSANESEYQWRAPFVGLVLGTKVEIDSDSNSGLVEDLDSLDPPFTGESGVTYCGTSSDSCGLAGQVQQVIQWTDPDHPIQVSPGEAMGDLKYEGFGVDSVGSNKYKLSFTPNVAGIYRFDWYAWHAKSGPGLSGAGGAARVYCKNDEGVDEVGYKCKPDPLFLTVMARPEATAALH